MTDADSGVMEPQTHELKLDAVYFNAVETGAKNFEVRRDDRGFQRGDLLILRKWGRSRVTGRDTYLNAAGSRAIDGEGEMLKRRITYVLTGGQFGIEPGYVVMGLEDADND